jgi:hypothetical protein
MRIEHDHADLLTNEGVLIAENISLVRAPDLLGTWLLTLPTGDTVFRGAFAPQSGFAVFAPDSNDLQARGAVLLMARANEDLPALTPDRMAYTRVGLHPEAGDGEVGTLERTAEDMYTQTARTPAPPWAGTLDDRPLGYWNIDPWRWTLYDSQTGMEFELVPTYQGMGAIAVERTPEIGGTGLLLAWAARAPEGLPRAGDLFCGGVTYEAGGRGIAPLSLPAALPGNDTFQWVGGFQQTIRAQAGVGGLFLLSDGLNPFLQSGAIAVGDAFDELLVVLPLDPQSARAAWGMMACVRTDLVPAGP